jgi:chromosome segregation ATPase
VSYFSLPGQVSKILTVVQQIQTEMRQLMSQDATIAAEAADEETQITSISNSLSSIQALLGALQGEQGLSDATIAAAVKVQTDLDALGVTAAADVTADTPPAAPPAS